jgi:hypothetical protein
MFRVHDTPEWHAAKPPRPPPPPPRPPPPPPPPTTAIPPRDYPPAGRAWPERKPPNEQGPHGVPNSLARPKWMPCLSHGGADDDRFQKYHESARLPAEAASAFARNEKAPAAPRGLSRRLRPVPGMVRRQGRQDAAGCGFGVGLSCECGGCCERCVREVLGSVRCVGRRGRSCVGREVVAKIELREVSGNRGDDPRERA